LDGVFGWDKRFQVFFKDVVHALLKLDAVPIVTLAPHSIVLDTPQFARRTKDHGVTPAKYGLRGLMGHCGDSENDTLNT
jgi:hypothetical protein